MIGDLMVGGLAALRTPAWLTARRIRQLQGVGPDGGPVPAEQSHRALRASAASLRLLGRIPLSPWRNTCLFRSIAACLALRALGRPAVLRLGVRRSGDRDDVAAHAWVECPGVESPILPREGAGDFVALR